MEKSQKKKCARLILRFETPPRPCSTAASGQAGGTAMGKLLSARRYRWQPDEGVPSLAVMVTLSQQRSYCHIPAIWRSSFRVPLQKLNLPHNGFKTVFLFVFCCIYNVPDFSRKNGAKREHTQKALCSTCRWSCHMFGTNTPLTGWNVDLTKGLVWNS